MRIGVINSYYYGNSQKKEQSFQGPQRLGEKAVQGTIHDVGYAVRRRQEGIAKLMADCRDGKHKPQPKPTETK